ALARRQRGAQVIGAPDLVGKDRLLVLALEPDLVAEGGREPRRRVERGPARDVVNAFRCFRDERFVFLEHAHKITPAPGRAPHERNLPCRRTKRNGAQPRQPSPSSRTTWSSASAREAPSTSSSTSSPG